MDLASIDSLCSKVSSGGTPSRKKPEYYSKNNDGHLWVKSKELLESSISDTEEKITDEGLKNSSAKYYPEGTVLLAMYGANVGQLAWLKKPATVNQAICAMVTNPEKVDFRYLFYALTLTREGLINKAHGAAQQNLNSGLVKGYEIPIHAILQQKYIANVLSAYDNLIENNNRRIVILEDMAQSLYKEWFVKFRFPGHQNIKFKESSLGLIPEGWEIGKLKDLTSKIGSGATPRGGKGAYKTAGIPLIRSMNIYDSTFITKNLAYIDDDQALKLKNVIVHPKDVLLNITGASVARCAIVPTAFTPARVNQHVAIIRVSGSEISPEYILHTLISNVGKARLLNIAQGGATREAITKAHIENFDILIPPSGLQTHFISLASNISLEKEVLFLKNENLKKQRDMLLPKLISGKVKVI